MLSRIALLLITLFWVTMNVLLWRSEYGNRNRTGGNVPLSLVWHKILTAPDNSSLEISHKGQRIGYCQWTVVGSKALTADVPTEVIGHDAADYRIDFGGNATAGDFANRVRFDLTIHFNASQQWQEFRLRVNLPPTTVELQASAGEDAIRLLTEDDGGRTERVIKLADLQNPEALARKLEVPLPLGALGVFAAARGGAAASPLALGMKWEARNDWIVIGHTSVRAYRLQARLLDRYQIVAIVSPVGELLRVELPDEIVLVNDHLNL